MPLTRREHIAIRRLCAAVVAQAIRDIVAPERDTTPLREAEARRWMASDDDGVLTLIGCCRVLGVDHRAARRACGEGAEAAREALRAGLRGPKRREQSWGL